MPVCQCVSSLASDTPSFNLSDHTCQSTLFCCRDGRCSTNKECRRRGAGQESGSACRGFGGGHRRCLKSNRAPSSRLPRCKYRREKDREISQNRGFKREKNGDKGNSISRWIPAQLLLYPRNKACDLEEKSYFLSLYIYISYHALIKKRFFDTIR